jgi:predicted Zn-dependent peptidase
MHRWSRPALVVPLGLLALLGSSVTAASAQSQDPRIDFVEDSLPNGLKILYHVDHATPVVGVDIWYNVGSRDERPGRTGFAHLFEHIMFKGSAHVPDGQHFSMLEAAGGIAGQDINGTTEFDRTNYFESVPSNQLELALFLESDRMGTLLDVLTQEKLDNQREVVKNERRQSYDNVPYGAENEKLLEMAFPENHPYHHDVIGSMDDLTAATLDDVRGFFRTYYVPNNAVLALAGDLDVDQAKALVRKYFGWIPRGPGRPLITVNDLEPSGPKFNGPGRAEIRDEHAPAPAVVMAFRIPRAGDRENAARAELLRGILTQGRSSYLYQKLVLEQQIATRVTSQRFNLHEPSWDLYVIEAYGRRDTDPVALEKALADAIEAVQPALSQESLDRARSGERYRFVDGLQSLGGFGGRADRLAEGWTYFRDPNYVNTILPRYDGVTIEQVKAFSAMWMVPAGRITLVFLPAPQEPVR